jgi:hypothetical protein
VVWGKNGMARWSRRAKIPKCGAKMARRDHYAAQPIKMWFGVKMEQRDGRAVPKNPKCGAKMAWRNHRAAQPIKMWFRLKMAWRDHRARSKILNVAHKNMLA